MLVLLVIEKAETETTLSNMFEFIQAKNHLNVHFVGKAMHVNQI